MMTRPYRSLPPALVADIERQNRLRRRGTFEQDVAPRTVEADPGAHRVTIYRPSLPDILPGAYCVDWMARAPSSGEGAAYRVVKVDPKHDRILVEQYAPEGEHRTRWRAIDNIKAVSYVRGETPPPPVLPARAMEMQ